MLVSILAAAVAAAAVSPDEPPTRAADEARLTRIKTEHWPAFYRNQDAGGLAAFLADSFVNVAPDGTIASRAQELANLRAAPWNPRNFRYRIDRIAWLSPDLALVVGRGASDRAGEDGRPCRHGYVSSNLLRRAPDAALGWRALSSHVSDVSCRPTGDAGHRQDPAQRPRRRQQASEISTPGETPPHPT